MKTQKKNNREKDLDNNAIKDTIENTHMSKTSLVNRKEMLLRENSINNRSLIWKTNRKGVGILVRS